MEPAARARRARLHHSRDAMLCLEVCLERHDDRSARREHALHDQRAVELLQAERPPMRARFHDGL